MNFPYILHLGETLSGKVMKLKSGMVASRRGEVEDKSYIIVNQMIPLGLAMSFQGVYLSRHHIYHHFLHRLLVHVVINVGIQENRLKCGHIEGLEVREWAKFMEKGTG